MTVATNALLEGRGARTALVATEGFTDLVELGRQARRDLYRLCAAHPPPLVPPERRIAAPERTGPRRRAPRARTTTERARSPTAVARPRRRRSRSACCTPTASPSTSGCSATALADALPGVHVSLSHEVVGTFREFERAATTEVDAALCPLLARLPAAAGRAPPRRRACRPRRSCSRAAAWPTPRSPPSHAALTVLSGPAGGAAAAALLAERSGQRDLLCFDMGGTSCDVCVVEDGRVRETAGREIGGRPLALPMVDIHTVGAGGGSIAWRDAGGALRVGPRSAGADPGPGRATAAAAPSRRSPTRTSSSACSTRQARWPAASTSTARRPSARSARSASATCARRRERHRARRRTRRWSARCA